ncbi:putative GTPase [Bacillus sp. TS-2]|nr:putative GTPase [Bacillus sp. TS-2]
MQELEQVIIVGVEEASTEQYQHERSMNELKQLAEACQLQVVAELSQKLEQIHPTTYIGSGKLNELKLLMEEKNVETVIFNDELSSSQIRNIESVLSCRVIDRTILILDIFAIRAKTKEAKLQVEIAEWQYMLPRLIGLRKSLGRQGGGGVGTFNRGAGEKKLELDRRHIESKINSLQNDLKQLVKHRKVQRGRRNKQGIRTVALVGYTNAGKSTLMNRFLEMDTNQTQTSKYVYEENMLFATLETSVRKIALPEFFPFLLTDTVGFVERLPHHLVKAFRSTLEEVKEADLLIHVVDYSNPFFEEQIEVTNHTLKEIGVKDIPMIYAYNKIDLMNEVPDYGRENTVYISTKNKKGLDSLTTIIQEQLYGEQVVCDFLIPYEKSAIIDEMKEHALIKKWEHLENGTFLQAQCSRHVKDKYSDWLQNESMEIQ